MSDVQSMGVDIPVYDLDRLKAVARVRLIEDHVAPTALNIYHLVLKLRTEELRDAARMRGVRLLGDADVPIADIEGGCVE